VAAGYRLRALYPRHAGAAQAELRTVRALTGSQFRGHTGDHHARAVLAHGYSDWQLWAVAKALCHPADTIVEVGAHVGTETVGYADIVARGRVIAFEPNPTNRECLAVNAAPLRNIELWPFAVGETAGRARFAQPPPGWSSGTGHVLGPDELRSGRISYEGTEVPADLIEVEVLPLDALVDEVARVHLLVADAEGSEVAMLRGARKLIARDRPPLVIEVAPRHLERAGSSFHELAGKLHHLGYVPFTITSRRLAPPQALATTNWLCLPRERLAERRAVERLLLRSALTPAIRGLHPLSRH
jgi:FkbM family methyltransferase